MKKTIGSKFLAFLLLMFLVSGCAFAPTPMPESPTFTSSPIPPTFTPEPTYTPQKTPSLTPVPLPTPIVIGLWIIDMDYGCKWGTDWKGNMRFDTNQIVYWNSAQAGRWSLLSEAIQWDINFSNAIIEFTGKIKNDNNLRGTFLDSRYPESFGCWVAQRR